MRSKNALKNLIVYLAYEILVFALGVIFPRFIILTYGSAVNGLTSTITRLLSLINLIQAGAVGAAIYQMYKPVAENDYSTQSAILYSSKKYYSKISIIYLTIATLSGIFYGFYLRDANLSFWEIFVSFLILALNGTFALFVNSLCDIYLSPHQKKYYVTISAIISQVVNYSLLAVVLLLKLHFFFVYLSMLIGGVVGALLNLLFYRKESKGLISKLPENKNYKIPDKKFLMLSSIGSEAVTASPSIIITTFVGLIHSSVFSVYSMIFVSMKTLLNSIQLSVSAIFGNLVKTSDNNQISRVYNVIELVTLMIGTILSTCIGFLILPFISLYTRGVTDVNYSNQLLAVLVVVYVCFFTFRTAFSYVATVYGLFKDTCTIILVFGTIGIGLSVLLVILFGMPYVMIGLLVNQAGCAISTLIIIKKKVNWFSIGKLLIRTVFMMILSSCGYILYLVVSPSFDTWKEWIIAGMITVIISVSICLLYCVINERKELRYIIEYMKNLKKIKSQEENI